MTPRPLAAAALLALFATPAPAEIDLDTVETCLTQRLAAGSAPTLCIDEALAPCIREAEGVSQVATLCFVEAREGFSGGIAARMEALGAKAPEELAAMAGIEVKYDLLAALLQCDRAEELALALGRDGEEAVLRAKTRCTAAAAGLAYMRLTIRTRDMDL